MSGGPGLNGGTSFNFRNFSGALFQIGLRFKWIFTEIFWGFWGPHLESVRGQGPCRICNYGPGSGRSSHLTNLANFMGPKARLKVTLSSKNENFGRARHALNWIFENFRTRSARTVILSLKLSKYKRVFTIFYPKTCD